ncbi:PREDICTED: uncharacterized protein LOC105144969 [Acromyrmex echinatior]|uniref:uncharacterized protein LOC105144969 n=1 Tax=Acromyrmex echinatior TaxID=103372 RepID=UPI000580F4B0|nr:PREDICTED: uncharacterized protein LOC105144969 [Acromyrmex echinatior]
MCLPTEIPSYKCRRTVLVKTSSLPSLRSTSHGTFEHVEEPAYGGDDDVRHDESARFVGGLRGRVLVFSMQAQWWPHPSSSVRRDKGSCAAGGRFYVLKRFKREPCHHHSQQKTPQLHHASLVDVFANRTSFINLREFKVQTSLTT